MRTLGVLLAAAGLFLSIGHAGAQSQYPTAGGQYVPGSVGMCVTSGLAAPCSPSGGGSGSSGPVTAILGAYVDGSIVTLGTESDSIYAGSGAASLLSIDKGIYSRFPNLNADGGAQVHVMNLALGAATSMLQNNIITTLGSPFQLNGSIGNTSFGISGTLPPFTSPPTVITQPAAGTITPVGCTVGVTSAQCLAAAAATHTLFVQNTSGSASIACNDGGTAVLNSNGSFMLLPYASISYGPGGPAVPTAALNCIASAASTPLYVRAN